jgi:pantetheine-phosphate adenylyltransferase
MQLYLQNQAIFQEYGITAIDRVAEGWRESHRFYHTENHLKTLLNDIEILHQSGEINDDERKTLVMVAYFHDIVYDVTQPDNEAQSADLFAQLSQGHTQKDLIQQIILETQKHQASSRLSQIFCDLDMKIVSHAHFAEMLTWEQQIFKEYQFLDYSVYRAGRLALLKQFAEKYPQNAPNLQQLISYVENFRPKIGIYPGSFNPFHYGHQNILEKAEKIFDKVITARGINPEKNDTQTAKLNLKVLKYRQFDNFSGFLTDYLNSKEKYADITLIRGLRNGDDLDYEINQLRFMEEMKPNLKIIFIACDQQYEHISSSAIKNLEKIKIGSGIKYLPE